MTKILTEAAIEKSEKLLSPKALVKESISSEVTTENKYPRLVLVRTGEIFSQNTNGWGDIEKIQGGITYRYVDGKQSYINSLGGLEQVKGYRGKLWIEMEDGSRVEYDTIERANGFTHIGNIDGSKKIYNVWFGKRRNKTAKDIITNYINPRTKKMNVVIHRASKPCYLHGCIAPGLSISENGVENTKEALDMINESLGGWDDKSKKYFQLEVRGYAQIKGVYP